MKNKWMSFIAWYEMLGGTIGIAVSLIMLVTNNYIDNNLTFIIFLVAQSLFAFSFVAGFLLFKGKREGIFFSKIIQILQIPHFIVGGVSYFFISGLLLEIYIRANEGLNLGFYTGIYSKISVGYSFQAKSFLFGINIIPIIILIYFFTREASSKLKNNEVFKQLNDLSFTSLGDIRYSRFSNNMQVVMNIKNEKMLNYINDRYLSSRVNNDMSMDEQNSRFYDEIKNAFFKDVIETQSSIRGQMPGLNKFIISLYYHDKLIFETGSTSAENDLKNYIFDLKIIKDQLIIEYILDSKLGTLVVALPK